MKEHVEIWTDGACSGNPGPGGWAALLRYGGSERTVSGGEALTTNNRMELRAAIAALTALRRACKVVLHTDSQYLRGGITQWMANWKYNGWRTADRKPVKNADLWQALDAVAAGHDIAWKWVRGHAGNSENELVDQLARAAMEPYRKAR